MTTIPNILSIAGSDPSGGAGIQADIKAISANGGYAMAAVTALTAQNTRGVSGVWLVDPGFVAAQVAAVFRDIRVDAVKIGMLGSAAILRAVAGVLRGSGVPLVLDPVLVATSGDALASGDLVGALIADLLPQVTVLTPNLAEAAALLGQAMATDRAGMEAQARVLLDLGPQAVLLKGGHLMGAASPDLLLTAEGATWLEAPRVGGGTAHGTGCTLSAALATQLALTGDLAAAARAAKDYTRRALRGAARLSVGQGNGPTDHFFHQRR